MTIDLNDDQSQHTTLPSQTFSMLRPSGVRLCNAARASQTSQTLQCYYTRPDIEHPVVCFCLFLTIGTLHHPLWQHDPYVSAAIDAGAPSRAAFKLVEMNQKHAILSPGDR